MFDEDFFSLRLFRLRSPENWLSRSDCLCFVFPKDGVGHYVNKSTVQRLLPGDILVAGGHPDGKLCALQNAELTFWSFSLRLEHLLPLFDGDEISLLQGIADSFKYPKVFVASSALAAKCHRLVEEVPHQFDLEHRSHLLRIAGAILNEEFKTAHHQRVGQGKLEDHIIQVFEQLSAEQLMRLPVEELAAKFSCSRRHLNRLFHQYFGFSVAALRMEMRLQKAVSLLRDVNAKVINVAESCGFNHLGLFNTCFKRRFGVSPGRWRKQAIEGKVQLASMTRSDGTCPLVVKGLCPMVGRAESVVPRASDPSAPAKSRVTRDAAEPGAKKSAGAPAVPVPPQKASQSLPLTP